MKAFSLILFLLFASSACGRIENFTNLAQQKIETEKTETEQPDEPPILEITVDAQGMFDVTGKTLLLNLYENGVIEFESRDEQKRAAVLAEKGIRSGRLKTEEINVLKRATIGREEVQKFLDLLNSEDFQNVKSEYPLICRTTDTSRHHKINFQNGVRQKSVDLYDYCGSDGVRNPNSSNMLDFPQVLSDLLTLAGMTTAKADSENSSNQLE